MCARATHPSDIEGEPAAEGVADVPVAQADHGDGPRVAAAKGRQNDGHGWPQLTAGSARRSQAGAAAVVNIDSPECAARRASTAGPLTPAAQYWR